MNSLKRCFTPKDSAHAVTLLATDAQDMEAFIQTVANQARLTSPDCFCGERPAVFFPVPYAAPYEWKHFDTLKRLIVSIRSFAGMRAGYNFQGVICLEVTAWLGHFAEELFQVLLKYLYDCCSGCAIVICANFNHPRELITLEQICLCIGFDTGTQTLYLNDRSDLSLLLDACFEKRRAELLGPGRELLASSLHRHIGLIPRRIQLLDKVADDLCRLTRNPGRTICIQVNRVEEYLADPHSTLCRIAGQPLFERGDSYELQL